MGKHPEALQQRQTIRAIRVPANMVPPGGASLDSCWDPNPANLESAFRRHGARESSVRGKTRTGFHRPPPGTYRLFERANGDARRSGAPGQSLGSRARAVRRTRALRRPVEGPQRRALDGEATTMARAHWGDARSSAGPLDPPQSLGSRAVMPDDQGSTYLIAGAR
jgi:hypothetical protein